MPLVNATKLNRSRINSICDQYSARQYHGCWKLGKVLYSQCRAVFTILAFAQATVAANQKLYNVNVLNNKSMYMHVT